MDRNPLRNHLVARKHILGDGLPPEDLGWEGTPQNELAGVDPVHASVLVDPVAGRYSNGMGHEPTPVVQISSSNGPKNKKAT